MGIKKISAIILTIVALAGVFDSVEIIKSGTTGVKITNGVVQEDVLKEGIRFTCPLITKVKIMNNKTQQVSDSGTASTSDSQPISYGIVVNYHLVDDASANMYKTTGEDYEEKIIIAPIAEVVRDCIAKRNIDDNLLQRGVVALDIKESLKERYGERIIVEEVAFKDFDPPESYLAAVNAKMEATQKALQAEEDQKTAIINAQTKVKEAEQEAEALRVKAQGEADANTILNASLTDKVIQHDAVEKWNGEPVKVAGNGVNTVLDIAGLAD